MNHLQIISDVHGKMDKFIPMLDNAKYNIQLGDLGFNYNALRDIPKNKLRWFSGNHDNMYDYYQQKHSLGDYGSVKYAGFNFFFVRGAFSIDHQDRRLYHDLNGIDKVGRVWYEEEQLNLEAMNYCYDNYDQVRPKVVLTHTCPREVSRIMGNPQILINYGYNPETFTTNSQELLQSMFELHQPNVWIFGHFHQDFVLYHEGTTFICRKELGNLIFDKNGVGNFLRKEIKIA